MNSQKNQGKYYTPSKIAKHMVKKVFDNKQYNKNIKILDLCCGEGRFLDTIIGHLHKKQDINIEYVQQNQLYGIDKDCQAIKKCQKKGYSNTICEDGLTHDYKNRYDIIISNPPYINIERVTSTQKDSYRDMFKYFNGRSDIFSLFIELSLKIIKDNGVICLIIPSVFLTNTSYKKLREYLIENRHIREFEIIQDNVFMEVGANVDTFILLLTKNPNEQIRINEQYYVKHEYFKENDYVLSAEDEQTRNIISKIYSKNHQRLKDKFIIYQGIVSGLNECFIIDNKKIEIYGIEKENLKPFLYGRDIKRYAINHTNNKIIYLTKDTDIKKFPKTEQYIQQYHDKLNNRRECKKGTIPYYGLQWSREQYWALHRSREQYWRMKKPEKIIIQSTKNIKYKQRITATLDTENHYTDRGLWNIIPKENTNPDLRILLGILNSNLINYIFYNKYLNINLKKTYLENIPLPDMDNDLQEDISATVQKLLNSKGTDKEQENRLNRLIYRAYDLIPEEIRTIEKSQCS